MIILLTSIIWFTALVLVVAVCRMAAHSDRTALRHRRIDPRFDTQRSPRLLAVSTPWEQASSLTLEDRRSRDYEESSEPSATEHIGNGAQEDLYVRP
jgi:hypothetical protein